MRIARFVTAAIAATTLVVFTGGAPAWAHNPLTKAVPAKNATVKESPAKIELTFLESLDDSFSIEVTDAQKKKVPSGKATVAGEKGTAALTGKLANGTYTVTYRLVADDGDPLQGSYKFTVAAPAPTSEAPSPSVSPVPSAAATVDAFEVAQADTSDDGPNWPLIVGIVAGAVVLGAGVFFAARRRS